MHEGSGFVAGNNLVITNARGGWHYQAYVVDDARHPPAPNGLVLTPRTNIVVLKTSGQPADQCRLRPTRRQQRLSRRRQLYG